MSSLDDWEEPMRRILEKMLLRRDAAAFRGSGDADDPMDLSYILHRIGGGGDGGGVLTAAAAGYESRERCIQDVRLAFAHAKKANEPGSKIHSAACALEESFEQQIQMSLAAKITDRPLSRAALLDFVALCRRLPRSDLAEVIRELEKACPGCLVKRPSANAVRVEVDLISPRVLRAIQDRAARAAKLASSSSSGGSSSSTSSGKDGEHKLSSLDDDFVEMTPGGTSTAGSSRSSSSSKGGSGSIAKKTPSAPTSSSSSTSSTSSSTTSGGSSSGTTSSDYKRPSPSSSLCGPLALQAIAVITAAVCPMYIY